MTPLPSSRVNNSTRPWWKPEGTVLIHQNSHACLKSHLERIYTGSHDKKNIYNIWHFIGSYCHAFDKFLSVPRDSSYLCYIPASQKAVPPLSYKKEIALDWKLLQYVFIWYLVCQNRLGIHGIIRLFVKIWACCVLFVLKFFQSNRHIAVVYGATK